MQFYTDQSRETEEHALPDAEWFHSRDYVSACDTREELLAMEWYTQPGYYWVACFPGCLWDGEPSGPFDTPGDAMEDARSE